MIHLNTRLGKYLLIAWGSLFLPVSAWAAWTQVGNSLNANFSDIASWPDLAFSNHHPYVAWHEGPNGDAASIYVKSYNGIQWAPLGGDLRQGTGPAGNPSIAFVNTTPYVAWYEFVGSSYQTFVKHHNGASWVDDGGSLNNTPAYFSSFPDLAVSPSGQPYVAWQESNGAGQQWVFVKRLNGAVWESVGTTLNRVSNNAAWPKLAFANTTPFVTWYEWNGAVTQVFASYFNGSAWVPAGTALNINLATMALNSSIAAAGGTPYVAWLENPSATGTEVHVKRYNGSDWEPVGGNLKINAGFDAGGAVITLDSGIPYVAWYELTGTPSTIYHEYVAAFNGSSWVQVGPTVNTVSSDPCACYNVAVDQGTVYVTTSEEESGPVELLSLRSNPAAGIPTPTPTVGTPLPTQTPSPTPSQSPVLSSTPTPTRTIFLSNTPSPTRTVFMSRTPTPTQSRTPTPINTPTPGGTPSPAATSTPAPASATRTVTASPTPRVSDTPGSGSDRLLAYPNPASVRVTFKLEGPSAQMPYTISIYNVAGTRVAQLRAGASEPLLVWDASRTAPGTYIYLAVADPEGKKVKLPAGKVTILK